MKKIVLGLMGVALLGSTSSFADEVKTESKTQSQSKSVEIRVHSKSDSESDGEGEVEVTSSVSGKIVIVGPDGKKQEFDLGDELPEGFQSFNIPGKNNLSMFFHGGEQEAESRYMIGVMCEPASDVLRSHLHLGDKGLVVTSLSKDMPAAEAGLQEGDILLGVGDKEISTLDALVEVVGASEGSALTFSVVQKGEQKEIEVTPKMSSSKLAIEGLPEGLQELVLNGAQEFTLDIDSEEMRDNLKNAQKEANRMIIRRIGPGFRFSDNGEFDVEELILGQEDLEGSKNGLQKQLKMMRKRLAEMEKKLESLSGEEK